MNISQAALLVVLTVYLLSLLFILLYSVTQGYLALTFIKNNRQKEKDEAAADRSDWPLVTIQLPVYNEMYVVERLIDAVAVMDYPREKLQIQLLDDSTDETVTIAAQRIAYWHQNGIDIEHIRRQDRVGYKAGALREGLKNATGRYIAIFDADFVPTIDFLKKCIPAFTHEGIGMVQARWGHLNRDDSMLTKSQAFTIDAHFYIEQTGRNRSGCFINFNGTAGVWRRDCIEDAGNWQADTLTEDLDLSYRAQLKGWNFVYLHDTVVPAELPPVMSAMKSQQYRWNKGGAETAKKLLKQLLRSSAPAYVKWNGTAHLLSSAVFIAVFLSSVCSIPLLHFKQMFPQFRSLYQWMGIFLISFFTVAWIYYLVSRQLYADNKTLWKRYLRDFPIFLSVYMGLSLHNAVAVIEGYAGKKTPFIRTPKFSNTTSVNTYLQHHVSLLALAELLLTFYFGYGIYYAFYSGDYTLLPFHALLTAGFGIISYYTLFKKIPVSQG